MVTPALYGPDGRVLKDSVEASTQRRYSVSEQGGAYAPRSGMGSTADKGDATAWLPTIIENRIKLMVIYVESWAAAKLINIPVDDMFIRGRQWESDDESAIEAALEAEESFGLVDKVSGAMKAARLYGTGMIVMLTNEAPLTAPLRPEFVREGDLANLIVVDRYQCSALRLVTDPFDADYGQPEIYEIALRTGGQTIQVHSSRVIRFDGRSAPTTDGWEVYAREWGISELVYALSVIAHDVGIVSGAAHLTQEASIPFLQIDGFKEALMGNLADEPSAEDIASKIKNLKSIYRLMIMDKNDEFGRVAVQFGGIPELIDRFALRLAAIAGIPATRFLSQSPMGMNSTGESDMDNYAIHVAALQERMLGPSLRPLDEIIARHIGAEPLEYSWRPLTDLSDEDQANVSMKKAEALSLLYDRNSLTEDEFRERLDNDPAVRGAGAHA